MMRPCARWRRLGADRAGTALIEFAITLPIMLTLYLGGFQLMDAISCNRKVTVTARAAADLVSQYSQLSKSDVTTILGAAQQIMYPFTASKALVRVSEISTDASGNSTITWSQAVNGTAYPKNSAFVVPATIRTNNSAIVFAEVRYNYTSPVPNFGLIGPRTLTQTVYMVPRKANTVDCTDCS